MKNQLRIIIVILIFIASCKKETINDLPATTASSDNASAATHTLILQPGPADGDDLWMKNWIRHPFYADTCDTKVGLIKGLTYPLKGNLVYTRSVIKFDGLNQIPAGAAIVSATLYLYGPTPKSKDVHVHLPMGNTSYPGSTKGDNTCYLQRITSSWNVNTISWNNMPSITTTNQYVLTASNKQWKYDVAADITTLVKEMIKPGTNNGLLLKLKNEEAPRAMGFLSSNSPEADRRPKLIITYSL